MTARSSHPPSLLTIVRRALEGECALPRGTPVVAAVSGGPDSMALLSALARLGPRFGLDVTAHGVDHGLRPEAAAELDLAEAHARRIGVPFDRTRVSVARGGNVQARARDLRWAALVEVARRRGAAIATAHHCDDRAETLLMRLLRGAGLRGLGVLPPRARAWHGDPEGARVDAEADAEPVTVIRPLLRARRADVMAHLERHGIPYALDPSNTDPRYLRTRVRQELMPLLTALDPKIVRHLEALADEVIAATAGLDAPRPVRAGTPSWIAALPRPTQEALAGLLDGRTPGARVWLPGGLVASVDGSPQRRASRNGATDRAGPRAPRPRRH